MSVMVAVRILICWLVVAVGWIEVGSYDRKAKLVTIIYTLNLEQDARVTIVLGHEPRGMILLAYLDLTLTWLTVPDHHLVLLIPDHIRGQGVGDGRLSN